MKFLVKPEALNIAHQFKNGSFSVNIDVVVLEEILRDEDSRKIFIKNFNDSLGVQSINLGVLSNATRIY